MSSLVFPSLVRSQVLEQHVELRALLERVIADATPETSASKNLDTARLETTARALCERFRTYLTFEDQALTPVLAVLDAWGPERVRALHDEHRRQRHEFDTFLGRFESGDDVEQQALALRELAAALLHDMAEEEEGCLRASLMSADSLTFERR
jgi:Hemerythrin HHE cation binding domain